MSDPPPQPSGPFTLLRPLYLLFCSGWYIPHTIVNLITSFNLQPLASFSDFKDHWFARFWTWFGPRSRNNAAAKVMPLLQNNARGVILDIGPGTGQWLYLFAQAMNPEIRKIYGVEPNAGLHSQLRANAVKAGLGDVYEIIGCGAEELGSKGGIQQGSVDTIVTVQCLCSIPGPERVIRDLYPLLKPGGKWLVYEHIKTKYQGDFVGYWQRIINVIWPHFFGGCNITRPTDEWLLRAGDWEKVELRPGVGENKYDTIPHVTGTLTKRK
ncbi:hypothetical protein Q7P37_001858 [Cladosporium fusiforme]